MKNKKKYFYLIVYLVFILIFYNLPLTEILNLNFFPDDIEKAGAKEVTIDSNVGTSDNGFKRAPNVVFISSSTGYSFGIDSDDTCGYWKTTNGGRTWGSVVQLTSQTDCLGTTVWYDRWTSGDTTGTNIHIVFGESGGDDLYYERLDTSDDSQLGEVNATGSNQGGTLNDSNSYSITKGTDGDLYMGTADDADSYVIKCTTTCGTASNWNEAGSNPMDADEDEVILRPLASSDIILIYWDISTDTVKSKVYTDSSDSWGGSWVDIGTASDNTSYKHAFDATVNLSTNDIYLCVTNDIARPDTDVDTYTYSSGSWSTNTDVFSNDKYLQCSIAYDEVRGNIIILAFKVNGGLDLLDVLMKVSTDKMSSWGSATTVNSTTDNNISISTSLNSSGVNILYAIWKNTDTEDFWGAALTDNVIQTSYRWQDDNSPPNSNTNMANADTAVTGIEIGQRLTARIQLENNGATATTTVFNLQFTTDDPLGASPSWTDVGASTAISYETGDANNGDAITATVCTASSLDWGNGTWHEGTGSTNSFVFPINRYTDFGFMIETSNAVANTTYYLRLYNKTATVTLNAYVVYPTLTTVNSADKRYSRIGTFESLPSGSGDIGYYFDELGYSNVDGDDAVREESLAGTGRYTLMMFVKNNSNSTDQIDVSWNGQTPLACSTANIKLEVYDFNASSWETRVTNSTCSADTDFTMSDTISTSISNYYSSNQTYWRAYQDNSADVKRLRTDDISFTFTMPLGIAAPASASFDAFTLNSSNPNTDTWATSTEQIVVSNGLSNGWTLSAICTDFETIEDPMRTIVNDNLFFDSDGVTSTDPTIVFTTWVGNIAVTEGTDNQNFGDTGSPATIASAGSGEGIGVFYIQPSFDLYIYATSTYSGSYNATVTLTLAFNDEYNYLYKFFKGKVLNFVKNMV